MTTSFCLLLSACLAGGTPETTCYDDPQPGDVLLFQTPGLARAIVYALGCSPGVTHSAIVVARPDGSLGLLEAPGNDYPVMVSDIQSRRDYHKGKMWIRKRRTPLTAEQSKCLTAFACRQEGKPFYFMGVFIPPIGKPISKLWHRCSTEEQLDPDRWFCSPLCIGGMIAAGLLDPCLVRILYVDPEDLKVDRWLDLSCGWEKPVRWITCEEKKECWFSITCAGQVQWWK